MSKKKSVTETDRQNLKKKQIEIQYLKGTANEKSAGGVNME